MASNSGAKDINKTVRLSQEQWRRAVHAARLETRRLGEKVYPTVLIAEVGMDGINEIVARAREQAASLPSTAPSS